MSTGIEWTDETWNPTTGCDQVSPGCDNCYALPMAGRLKAMGQPAYQQDGDPRTSGPGFALQMHEDRLDQPLRWTRARRVFVNSMSDLFHPKVTDDFISQVFAVMALAEQHTFQVLTKRPKRMLSLLGDHGQRTLADGRRPYVFRQAVKQAAWAITCARGEADSAARYMGYDAWFEGNWPLRNVWLGTSVEDQQRADERIPALLDTPAAVRFLSCEPLLGPVDLRGRCVCGHTDSAAGFHYPGCAATRVAPIDWVIVGGESGPGARPMHPSWAEELRDQCTAAGVPFFFKQWGAHGPYPREIGDQTGITAVAFDGCFYPKPFSDDPDYHRWARDHDHTRPNRLHSMYRVGKHAAGRELDGRTWDEFPKAVTANV